MAENTVFPDARAEWLRRRWDWLARFYDMTHLKPEWRERLCREARGKTLEVGAGTGLNLPYYPPEVDLTLVDLSGGMLERARKRAETLGRPVAIHQVDIERLDFPDESFDTVVATCVFCTVPNPVQGLREVRRVCRRDGQVLLLEHVRSMGTILGPVMDALNPVLRSLNGTNINRRTVENVKASGLKIVSITPLWRDILLEIKAVSRD
ncbi:MAG: class I SAM-dependent methyltransferase [Methanocella sp.]